jgi:hypothetical protein
MAPRQQTMLTRRHQRYPVRLGEYFGAQVGPQYPAFAWWSRRHLSVRPSTLGHVSIPSTTPVPNPWQSTGHPTARVLLTETPGAGLGPATDAEMAAAVTKEWIFDAIHDLLAARGVRLFTSTGYERGHSLHLLGAPYMESLTNTPSADCAAEAITPTSEFITPAHTAVWFTGTPDKSPGWVHGEDNLRREAIAEVLTYLHKGTSLTTPDLAFQWSFERVTEGGSLLMGLQRLMLSRWWDDRMTDGYTRKAAETMLALLLPPATMALVTFNPTTGIPCLRFPDD